MAARTSSPSSALVARPEAEWASSRRRLVANSLYNWTFKWSSSAPCQVYTAVVKVGIRPGLDTRRSLCSCGWPVLKWPKKPQKSIFFGFGGLQWSKSWITLSVNAALGASGTIDETKNAKGPLHYGYRKDRRLPTIPLSKVAAELDEKTGMTKKDIQRRTRRVHRPGRAI